jgi:hypothetical protein
VKRRSRWVAFAVGIVIGMLVSYALAVVGLSRATAQYEFDLLGGVDAHPPAVSLEPFPAWMDEITSRGN